MKTEQTVKAKEYILKLVYGGVLTALGVLLPQAFHMFGQNAGMVFLPIQIPVLLAGILLGPYYGGIVGLLVPILSSVLTGMPPVPKVYFMLFELVTYGVVSGWLSKKFNIYANLGITMAAGRIVYGLALIFGVQMLQMDAPFMNTTAFISGITAGIPGIAVQLLLLPVIYYALKRGGLTFEK